MLIVNNLRLDNNSLEQDSGWRHGMETLSVSLTLCEGNLQVTGGFRKIRVIYSFDIFLFADMDKLMIKLSSCQDSMCFNAHETCNVFSSKHIVFDSICGRTQYHSIVCDYEMVSLKLPPTGRKT